MKTFLALLLLLYISLSMAALRESGGLKQELDTAEAVNLRLQMQVDILSTKLGVWVKCAEPRVIKCEEP